jgi:hypothetical protein
VNELKRKYDPKGILNPGFFKYEAVDHLPTEKLQSQGTQPTNSEAQIAAYSVHK